MFSIFKKEKPLPDRALVTRGKQAAELLRSDVFHTCVEELEREVWKQFMDTPANDPEAREILYTHINALRYMKEKLETYAQQGKMADAQLKQKGMK